MSTTKTKERPILFSPAMVRAILDGRKTQTRRVIKHTKQNATGFAVVECDEGLEVLNTFEDSTSDENGVEWPIRPFTAGMELWVRETWQPYVEEEEDGVQDYIRYKAGGSFVPVKDKGKDSEAFFATDQWRNFHNPEHWRPSIHMPRWASRIQLLVTDVSVERLRDISTADAVAEGMKDGAIPAITGFALVWNEINGDKHPWNSNPWVWVVEFTKLEPTP